MVSIAAKKKEPAGQFKNAGRTWTRTGEPVRAGCHGFPGGAAGKTLPYGSCDMAADTGWVNAGTGHGTAAAGNGPRHRRVRGGIPAPLAGRGWPGRLSARRPAADHRGCGRPGRVPHVEDVAGRAGAGDGPSLSNLLCELGQLSSFCYITVGSFRCSGQTGTRSPNATENAFMAAFQP